MVAHEHDEEPLQDLRSVWDILWMLRQLSNQPNCDLDGLGELLNSDYDA